jgi:hypothetical protein
MRRKMVAPTNLYKLLAVDGRRIGALRRRKVFAALENHLVEVSFSGHLAEQRKQMNDSDCKLARIIH